MENELDTLKKAVLIVESQPPHLGELISLISIIDSYDLVLVSISSTAKVIPLRHVLSTWAFITQPYKEKIVITVADIDFDAVAKLPDEFKDYDILTTSKPTFVHLSSIGANVKFVARAKGYWPIFERVAYRQGIAYDWLEATSNMR